MLLKSFRCAFAGLLVVTVISGAGAESWEITDNAFHSYFNVQGDATQVLTAGTQVRLNGRTLKVHLTHGFDKGAGKFTYVQLDQDHGADIGDIVTLASDEGSSGGERTTTSTTTVAEEEDEPAERMDAQATPVGEFSTDLPFVKAVSVADVKAEVRAKKKPGLIFVTQSWCGACKHLKTAVSRSETVKTLMKDFVVVHAAAEAGEEWQGPGKSDGYIPRVYFMGTDGELLEVPSPNADYPYFFPDSSALEKAMTKVLSKKGHSEL